MSHAYFPIPLAVWLATIVALPAAAQSPKQLVDREVRSAALERAQIPGRGQAARFGRGDAQVGDQAEQAISVEMRLDTSLRRGSQLVEKKRTTMRSKQRRLVTTTGTVQGRISAVEVRYLAATKDIVTAAAEAAIDATVPADQTAAAERPATPLPVQGKTYHCRRDGGEDGKLVITDAAGHIPPSDEYEIVAQNMEMVGRSNPLAEFLAGRTIALGETISLPKEVARRLFNLGERYGEVTRFDLTLQETANEGRVPCAVFLARVEAASNDASQMRLDVEGPMVVELATCRVVRTSFTGPIGLSETRGSYSTAHQLIGTGRLKMSVASTYRDARQ